MEDVSKNDKELEEENKVWRMWTGNSEVLKEILR